MLFRIICLLLLFLCGSACENIQNSPEPDPLMALPSAPVRLNLRNQREADIPFFSDLRLQDLQSQLTIEITAQPRHGSITPDTIRKVFVYRADPDWFGTDTAAFRVCSPLSCRNNPIYITLSDTGNACIPVAPDLTLQIPAGSQTTPLPVSLTCAGLVLNLTENPAPGQISLSGNSLVTAFPEFTSLIGTIGYRICNGAGLCDTGQITLVVQPDSSYCRNRFLPADDNIFILSNVVRKSGRNRFSGVFRQIQIGKNRSG
jgi:hypothetical protein